MRLCWAAVLLVAPCDALWAAAAPHRIGSRSIVPARPLLARVGELKASGGGPEPELPEGAPPIQLYPQRWVQLGYLSALALLSDWVCFSVAAAPETWEATYAHDPATLIDIFLFTNVLFCFLEPTIVRRVGLRSTIVGAAMVMSAGCALRSGLPLSGDVPAYASIVAGTILVGAAQPMFQCTPPLLSATWFGAEERATATATAINFNQVGIAIAFLVGGAMATSTAGLSSYFDLITLCCLVVTAGAFLQFEERPVTPPSSSMAAKIIEEAQKRSSWPKVESALFDESAHLPPWTIRWLRPLLCTPER